MNYEELFEQLQPHEKALKDKLASMQKLCKNLTGETERGDVKYLRRDLQVMAEAVQAMADMVTALQATAEAFDCRSYFENGDFARQMVDACEKKGIDVKGEFPVYEMFPYRVKIDQENQDIYLDKKRLQCMRPKSLADMVKTGQEKLNRASFNAASFANELADAYDLARMKGKKPEGTDIYLTSLYKFLTPMSRFRKDYDLQSYAFDLARLYNEHLDMTKNGRRFAFGPSRFAKQAIRILDQNGREEYLTTICFYEREE